MEMKITKTITLISLLFLTACSNRNKSGQEEGNSLDVFTGYKVFDSVTAALKAVNPPAGAVGQISLMSQRLGGCTKEIVGVLPAFGAPPASSRLVANGDGCPVTLNYDIVVETPPIALPAGVYYQFTYTATYEVKTLTYKALNDVDAFQFSGQLYYSLPSEGGDALFAFNGTLAGSFHSQKYGTFNFTYEGKTTGAMADPNTITETILKIQNENFSFDTRHAKGPISEGFFIDGSPVSPSQYQGFRTHAAFLMLQF